jgi:hypothetical protein
MKTPFIFSFVIAIMLGLTSSTFAQKQQLKPIADYGIPGIELNYSTLLEFDNLVVLINKIAHEKNFDGWALAYIELKGSVNGEEKSMILRKEQITDEVKEFFAKFSTNGPHDLFLNNVSIYHLDPPQKEHFEKMVIRVLPEE